MFNFLFYTLLPFILILGVLILIHELGHFLTARLFGVGVKEFAIGLPPRIFRWRGKETDYSLGAIPIGGYVRLVGEDEAENAAPNSFQNKPPWQRFIILFAGSATHFILAFLIFFGLTWGLGESIPNDEVYIVETAVDSPAATAGLLVGDQVLTLNGAPILGADDFLDKIDANVGESIELSVLGMDDAASRVVSLTPRTDPPAGQGALGVSILSGSDSIPVGPIRAAWVAGESVVLVVEQTLAAAGQLFTQIFTRGSIPEGISGPVGIARMTGEVAEAGGVLGLLSLAAILAANLAIFNLLPIPALDGGRLVFVLWEWIFRRRIAPEREALVHTVGFGLLLLLLLSVTIFNDVL